MRAVYSLDTEGGRTGMSEVKYIPIYDIAYKSRMFLHLTIRTDFIVEK